MPEKNQVRMPMITKQLYADEQTKKFFSHYAHAALKEKRDFKDS
jgi:hypothetical protein